MKRGLIVAVAHAALLIAIAAIGGSVPGMGPTVWSRAHMAITQPGGRYLRLDVEVQRVGFPPARAMDPCRAEIHDGTLTCVHDPVDGRQRIQWDLNPEARASRIRMQNLIYLRPGLARPTAEDELWAEVSVSPRRAPQVIRLGVKRSGVLQPLW